MEQWQWASAEGTHQKNKNLLVGAWKRLPWPRNWSRCQTVQPSNCGIFTAPLRPQQTNVTTFTARLFISKASLEKSLFRWLKVVPEPIISTGKWLAATLEHSGGGCLPPRGSSPRISPSQRHAMNGYVCVFFSRASQSSLEAFLLCKENRNACGLMQWQLHAHREWKGGCLMAKRWVDAG